MNPAQLLAHFDRLAEAPDAIPRLRRFILDLAVRGKLVVQDPNDEPASELLRRIQARKARLKPSKTSVQHMPAEMTLDWIPFTLPAQWVLARLGDVIDLVSGQHLLPSEYSKQEQSGLPYITGPADFGPNGLVISRYAVVRKSVAKRGHILLTVKGAGIGKTAVCDVAEVVISRQLMAMAPIGWDQRFLLLITHRLANALKKSARSLIPGISREDVDQFVFPLPPLLEQRRIVAKLDELMVLCDRLEAAQRERESRRDRLVAASLHRLDQPAADENAFREHARFYFNHLPRLTTRPEHVKQLRQTILNLAVRGKLVEQDPTDEPASELLRLIQAERARLLEEDRIRKLETLAPVGQGEIPFPIPLGWKVARMGSLARKLGAGSTPLGGKSVYQTVGVPFLRSQNVHPDGLRLEGVAYISRTTHERMSGTHVDKYDILLNITGASIGRCALVPHSFVEGNVSQHVAIIRLFVPFIREFIHLSLSSPFYQQLIDAVQVGVSREGLSMQQLRLFPMLVPPVQEQHRIVAKVADLNSLCDRLEAQLATRRTDSRTLFDAILHETLNAESQRPWSESAKVQLYTDQRQSPILRAVRH